MKPDLLPARAAIPARWEKPVTAALVLFSIALLAIAVHRLIPIEEQPCAYGCTGVDWRGAFRPAALKVLRGENPYEISGYMNPPWTLLAIAPFAALPIDIGYSLWFAVGMAVYLFVAYRLTGSLLPALVIVLSPVTRVGFVNGNLDWLAALGFILPPQIGLFFVLMKPQIGAAVALYWLVEAWRAGKFREVVRVFAPVSLVTLLSFALYGFWPLQSANMHSSPWNTSLFPWLVPLGVYLLYRALKEHNIKWAIVSAPFFAPYVVLHSWTVPLMGLPVPVIYAVCVAIYIMYAHP